MKKRNFFAALALVAMLTPAASAMAEEVFSIWATGYTQAEATQKARANAVLRCTNAGYANSYFELVDVAQGGLVTVYGLVTCTN